jgi:phospholipid/cholesterol/gamma-HCH transport system substrate-binding protein
VVKVDRLQHPYRISGDFASSVGVLPGAEVDYLGVTYGTVASVHRIPGGVTVSMKIDHGKHIPDGSIASLFRKSALGEQYVEFTPPIGYQSGGPYYRAGAHLPIARTTVPLEFSELLRSLGRLVAAIPPDAAGTVVHELAVGVAGRADALRTLADAGDRIGQTLAARTQALDRLATNNTQLTHVITEHSASLGASLEDLRQLAETLRNARGDTSLLLDRGSQLLGETADLVAKHKGDLDCVLKDLELLTDTATTPARLAGLQTVLQVLPPAFDGLFDATDLVANPAAGQPGQRWLRVGLIDNPAYHPAPEYVPPKTLPAVASVPACASPLRSSGVNYVPTAASTSSAVLPATGGAGLLALGLAALALSLTLRQRRALTTT